MILLPGTAVTVTLDSQDAPEADKVRYTMLAMTSGERLKYEAERAAIGDAKSYADSNARLNALLLRTITAWDNITDATGAAVPLTDDGLNQLRYGDKLLIAAELPAAAEWGARRKNA